MGSARSCALRCRFFSARKNARSPDKARRLEIELWYRSSEERRRAASQILHTLAAEAGGKSSPRIYDRGHRIPRNVGQKFLPHTFKVFSRRRMFGLHWPTRSCSFGLRAFWRRDPANKSSNLSAELSRSGPGGPPPRYSCRCVARWGSDSSAPVAHRKVDVWQSRRPARSPALVARRFHGTGMASLILHGDRNEQNDALSRPCISDQ